MNVPAIGSPKPTSCANALILNKEVGVVDVTTVCWLNPAGCLNNKKIYLCASDPAGGVGCLNGLIAGVELLNRPPSLVAGVKFPPRKWRI